MRVELEDQRPAVGDDAVAGPVEAVRVGLEAVAQRDARHAQAALGVGEEPGQEVALLVVEPAEVLGDDRAEQHRAVRRTAGREVVVAERNPPGRLVPTGVADVELGEDHTGRFVPRDVRRWRPRTPTSSPRSRPP